MNTIQIENKITTIIIKVKSRIRSFLLFGNFNRVNFGKGVRLDGQISFGNNINIRDYSIIRGANIRLEDNVYIHENVLIRASGQVLVGEGSTINKNCCILIKVKIGKICSIAPNVVIVGSNHIFSDNLKPIKEQGVSKIGVVIEDDVWIGANATILDGVTIGKGSIIAAGAVVIRDVEPNSVVGGIPAKLLRKRD